MPKIQEYNLQTSAAGPERQTAANIEDTGNVGMALENAGAKLESAASYINRRARQADVADQYAAYANTKAEVSQEFSDRVQGATDNDIAGTNLDGTPGQSMQEKFSDYLDDKFNSMPVPSTAAGREFSERQQAALKSHMLIQMGKAQTQLTGQRAVKTVQTAVNTNAASLEDNPSTFKIDVDAHDAYVDKMVEEQGLPANRSQELKQWGHQQLAIGAAKGQMIAGSYTDDSGKTKNTGLDLLDAGGFDSYITRAQKDELRTFGKMQIHATDADNKQQQKDAADARLELQDKMRDHMLQQMVNGGPGALTAKQIVNSKDLDPDAKIHMIHELESYTKNQASTSGAKDAALARIYADPASSPAGYAITTPAQIMALQNVATKDKMTLIKQLGRTPEALEENKMMAQVVTTARSALTRTNPLLGQKDPTGDANMSAYLSELYQKHDQLKSQGKTRDQMFNPASPDYLGNMYLKYQKSPQQLISEQASQLMRMANPTAANPTPPSQPPPAGSIRVQSPDGRIGNYKGKPPAGWKVLDK